MNIFAASKFAAVNVRRNVIVSIMSLVFLTANGATWAGVYLFTNIADSSGPLRFGASTPSINDSGTLAFRVFFDDHGGRALVSGNGGALTTIATNIVSNETVMNNRGTVVFQVSGGPTHAHYGDGSGPVTPVALPPGASGSGSSFAINDRGTVAYSAFTSEGAGIFAATGSRITTIADPSDGPFGAGHFDISINNAGTVVFASQSGGGRTTLFAGSGGPLSTIANTDGQFSALRHPSINRRGSIAFLAELDAGGSAIYVADEGVLTSVADTSGKFDSFTSAVINNRGTIAFGAQLDDGGFGIFTAGEDDPVIAIGDELFGSTVIGLLGVAGDYLNNRGQIGFEYRLADGRWGVARADPRRSVSEPWSLALLGVAFAGLAIVRRPRQVLASD